jgi:hypothetical protein
MLTDRENRPALTVTLAAHALMMVLLAVAACNAPLGNSYVGVLIIMPLFLLFFATVIAGIVWVVEIPIVRKLNDSPSALLQAVGCALFMAGLVAVVGVAVATWASMHFWSYAGFALLSGYGAVRQFRLCKIDDRQILLPAFPAARLVT